MGDTPDYERADRPWTAQPAPVPQPGEPVVHVEAAAFLRPYWPDVADDLVERGHYGARKYNTPLQVDNGRDPIHDAYEEALDVVAYLAQAHMRTGAEWVAPSRIFRDAVYLAASIRAEIKR